MSLRFIPDESKLSPLKMFLKYAEDKEKQRFIARRKKLLSLEYFLYVRGTIRDMFGFQELFINSMLDEFNIKEKEPKEVLNEIFSNMDSKYLINGKLNFNLFNNDYNERFDFLANKYEEKNEVLLVQEVINNNDYEVKDIIVFKNNKELNNISEYKFNLANRIIEMEFLTMYLAKTNDKNLKDILDKNEDSQILNDIINKELFINIRKEYQEKISDNLITSKKNKSKPL